MSSSESLTLLLRDRRIALYWTGLLLSLVGSSMWRIALPWVAISLTGSSVGVATALLVTLVPALIVGPAAGALADRYPRQKAIVGLDLGRAVLFGVAIIVVRTLTGWSAVFSLSAIALIESLATTWYGSARMGVIKALAADGYNLQSLSALDRTTKNIADITGLLAGGVAIASLGINWVLALNGASYAIAGTAALIARLPSGELGQRDGSESRLAYAGAGLRYVRENWSARQALFAQAGLNLAIPLIALGLPILAREAWGSATWLGFAAGAFAAGGLAASLVTGFRKLRPPTLRAIWSAISIVAIMILITAETNRYLALPALFVAGFISNVVIVVTIVNLQTVVADSLTGRVFALAAMSSQASAALVILILGVLASPARFPSVMASVAITIAVAALLCGAAGGGRRLRPEGSVETAPSIETPTPNVS